MTGHVSPSGDPPSSVPQDVVICGMGTLGVECARVLERYRIPVRGVTLREAADPSETADPVAIPIVVGDCRRVEVLRAGGVERCRAVLLVTGDARVNMEAALAVRKLNAGVRIVARTVDLHVNALLSGLLGNFVSHEPSRLAAGSLALAALRADIIGHFLLEGRLVRVVRHRLEAGDRWIGARIADVSTHDHAVLAHEAANARAAGDPSEARSSSSHLFHDYDPEAPLAEDDVLTTLVLEGTILAEQPGARAPGALGSGPGVARRAMTGRFFAAMSRPAKVAVCAAVALLVAVLMAVWLFPLGDPSLSRADAFFTAAVLMTGGTYADLFPAFNHLSDALRLFSVVLTVLGTIAVGLLYAWLTERIMTLRLRIAPRRPRPPEGDHVVIVGLGRVGQTAAALYRTLSRPAVAVDSAPSDDHGVRDLHVVRGSGTTASVLREGGIESARGFLAATGDDWQNLEMALLARTLNGDCALAIGTHERRFSVNVAGIVPNLHVVCVPVVAAKAFAASALGQTVLDLFHLAGRTVYVVEHRVQAGDGLEGRTLSEIAEGYSVVPVLYEPPGGPARPWSVVDRPVVVAVGYRVVLLGPSSSLQRITRCEMRPRTIAMELHGLRPNADRLGAAGILAQQLACSLEEAHGLLASAPTVLARRCYRHQARRLRSALELAGAMVGMREETES